MEKGSVMHVYSRRGENVGPELLARDCAAGGGFDLKGRFGRHTPVSMQPIPDVRLFYSAPVCEGALTSCDLDSLLDERIHATKI